MKTMQDFVAQQLSKKQMNELRGGANFICTVALDGGPGIEGRVIANSADHAAAEVALIYMDMGVEVDITCAPAKK